MSEPKKPSLPSDDEIPDFVRCQPFCTKLRDLAKRLRAEGQADAATTVYRASMAIYAQAEQIDGMRNMIARAQQWGVRRDLLVGDDAKFFREWREFAEANGYATPIDDT